MTSARRRGPRWRGFTILLIAIMQVAVSFGAAADAAPARAGGLVQNPPPDLLNDAYLTDASGLYFANHDEFVALQDLQTQAITTTLVDHQLPSTDAAAAQSWGRDDAEGELYALLVQAANTAACSSGQTAGDNCRTTDQQQAVNWLADMARREGMQAADAAGLEYVKWSGHSQDYYTYYVNKYNSDLAAGLDTSADKTAIETELNAGFSQPNDYALNDGTAPWTDLNTAMAQATAGYCVYRSPAPYGTDYQGNIYSGTDGSMPAICMEPGGGIGCLVDCNPDTPAYDDFVKWGQADAQYALINNFDYTESAHDIALGIGLGGVVAAVATGVTLAATLGSAMAGTAFAAVVFPNAAWVTGLTATTAAAIGATGATDAAAAAASAGAVSAGAIGAIVGAVLLFVTGTTLEVIKLVQDSQLPGQIATLVENAPTQSYDPATMINDTNGGAGELFSLFVDATGPSPVTNCTDYTLASNPVCLDPPPPASPDLQHDPDFSVSENGGPAVLQPTITYYDKVSQLTALTRIHNNWFLVHATDNQGNPIQVTDNTGTVDSTLQTLRIMFTDWNGKEQSATLVNVPNVGYKFVTMQQQSSTTTLDPTTCAAANTCAFTDTIDYVDAHGNKYAAQLVNPVFPTVTTPTWSPASPIEAQPVSLSTIVGPSNGAFGVNWAIQDKPLSLLSTICTTLSGQPCPPPTVGVAGNPATYSFPTSGAFSVTVTASDDVGRSASKTVSVNVADVPPQLTVFGVCPIFLICFGQNVFLVPPGTATTINGEVAHAGTEDIESLDVNWGDGTTPDHIANAGLLLGLNGSFDMAHATVSGGKIHLPFTMTHNYANPGTYRVILTSTDQSGATSVAMETEQVLYPTQTTLGSWAATTVFGQPVTLSATVSSAGGTPTGTVTFLDGNYVDGTFIGKTLGTGTLSTSGGFTTATLQTASLGVGTHTIWAAYGGDGGATFQPSESQPLTQTVNKAATSAALTSAPNPAVWGQAVTLTATVAATSPGAGNPSGTVEFMDGGSDISGCAAVALSTTTETASCTTSSLAVANHTLAAAYSGDGNFTASTASGVSQAVNKASTSTAVTTSSTAATRGQPVTFTADVVAVSPGAGMPTGSVTFYDGTASLGTATLGAGGEASLTTTGLAVGAHAITARYTGDGDFVASVSGAITQYTNTDLSSYPLLPSGAYNLGNVNLSGAYLVNVNLSGASLANSNLTGADLMGANLSNATLTNTVLKGANLAGANLSAANLTKSNLTGASLAGANLAGANLTGVNLKGATGLGSATLTGVIWSSTTCPDGTSSGKDGGTCVGHL